jgi:hypothetical protein
MEVWKGCEQGMQEGQVLKRTGVWRIGCFVYEPNEVLGDSFRDDADVTSSRSVKAAQGKEEVG